MSRVYLDSCIVIYLLEGDEDGGSGFIGGGATTRVVNDIFVSALTEMECLVHPIRDHNHKLIETYRTFFSGPSIRFVPLSKSIFETATLLRAEHRLKTPDALHLAFALESGCEEFWTNDFHPQKAAGERIRMRVPVDGE